MGATARHLLGAVLAVALVLGSACGGSADAEGPPDINYGRDICFECNMIISEARFAAAYRLADGTEKVFDDIGEMLKHGHKTGEIATAEAWVHDFETEAWVTADRAHHIVTRTVATPMAFGIISFEDAMRAESFARDVDAEVVDWATILRLPPDDLLTISDQHAHDEMDTGDDGHNQHDTDMNEMEEGATTP